MPHINAHGLAILKRFEGCRLTAYTDPVGVLTIGFGHTGGVTAGETITQAQADALLANDLRQFEAGVNAVVSRNLTPNQFSACVSFAFNVGLTAFTDSTLLRKINLGDFTGAQAQFGRWVHGNGDQVLAGLVARRDAEAALFGTP